MKNLKKLYQILQPLKGVMILLSFLAIFDSILSLVAPQIYKMLINNITGITSGNISHDAGVHNMYVIAFYLGLVFIFTNAIYVAQNYFTPKLGAESQRLLRNVIFDHLSSLSIDFYEKEKVGRLVNKINRGINYGSNFVKQLASWFAAQIITGFLAIFLIFALDWMAGVIVTLAASIYIFTTTKLVKKVTPLHEKVNRKADAIGAHTFEVVSGIHTVKSFAREETEKKIFRNRNKQWVDMNVQRGKYRAMYLFGRFTIMDFARALILVMAGFKALNGQITPGDIMLYITYISYIMWPLNQLTYIYDDGQEAMKSVDDIIEFLETEPDIKDKETAKTLKKVKGRVEFSNVDFEYHNKKKILKNVSFCAFPGENIAFVGPSGTGKTTITKLLVRFYDVKKGKVSIDGVDVRDLTQKSLRKNVGVVQQEIMLFNDTIKKNISYGTSGSKHEDIVKAAKAANIHDFIMTLPKKYDTFVGERGIKLSGGEKQRVAIARALLKNPPILILDEATSHLDSQSEQLVQEALWRLIEGRTTIIIAHRLATVMKADRIVVMEKGKVVEEGNHKQLVASGGLYSELFNIQSGAMLFK